MLTIASIAWSETVFVNGKTGNGDVNGDGNVTPYDAVLIMQYIVGSGNLSEAQLIAADVTSNGTITGLDAILILQYTVGLITQFPKMTIKSPAFEEGGMIPIKYTCDGMDVSPPLLWTSVPYGTKSLALICDDPDAPVGTWVHWVIFNLPENIKELPENIPPQETLPNGAKQGINDFLQIGYGGPCPPSGTHRYYFKLYALGTELNLEAGITKAELLQAMEGHILAVAQLMGRYTMP